MVGGDSRVGSNYQGGNALESYKYIYIRDGSGPNCRPRGPVTQNPPVAGPVDALSFNVTPSLDINYILNNKISSQDQNCEFIENTVIPDHCKKDV